MKKKLIIFAMHPIPYLSPLFREIYKLNKSTTVFFLDTLGWIEYKRNNYNSAVYFLEKSVSILPRSAEVIDHLGDCYLMLNRKKEAVFEWNKALKYETDKSIINKIKAKITKHEHLL